MWSAPPEPIASPHCAGKGTEGNERADLFAAILCHRPLVGSKFLTVVHRPVIRSKQNSYLLLGYTWFAFALARLASPFVQRLLNKAWARPNKARTKPGSALDQIGLD